MIFKSKKSVYSNPQLEDYGYSPYNPIEVTGISEEEFYLSNLITTSRIPITFEREGSVSGNTSKPVDKYNIFVGSKKICDLYIYGYSSTYCIVPPKGFFYIEKVKWGDGIPEYNDYDLMTTHELQDFGIEVVMQFCTEYEVIGFNNELNVYPSIYFLKDNMVYAVLVKSGTAPDIPEMTQKDIDMMSELATRLNVVPLFASVGFGASDPERFDAGILLRGDGFYARFTGLEEITVNPQVARSINDETILNYMLLNFLNRINANDTYTDLYLILKDSQIEIVDEDTYAIAFPEQLPNSEKEILEQAHNKNILTNLFTTVLKRPVTIVLKYNE